MTDKDAYWNMNKPASIPLSRYATSQHDAYLVVFISSMSGLAMEVIAVRFLAPHVGSSLFTWSTIIGVILAGFSIGNYIGGRAGDRWPRDSTVSFVFWAAAFAVPSVLFIQYLDSAYQSIPGTFRIVVMATSLFLLPSVFLGMVTPLVIKLCISDVSEAGALVGRTYAASTAGSIAGIFLGGFFMVPVFGARGSIFVIAMTLCSLAIITGRTWKPNRRNFTVLLIFALLLTTIMAEGLLGRKCIQESQYYCVRVFNLDVEERQIKGMLLDKLIHGFADLEDPSYLHYDYERVLADVLTRQRSLSNVSGNSYNPRVLMIGGGTYTLPVYLDEDELWDLPTIEVVEIDSKVEEVAQEQFGLSPDSDIATYIGDARIVIHDELRNSEYDIVVMDAYNDVSVPYHLTTLEFHREVRKILAPDGLYLLNIIDKMHSGNFLRSTTYTLGEVFEKVYVLRNDDDWFDDSRYTFIVVATNSKLPVLNGPDGSSKPWISHDGGVSTVSIIPGDIHDSWMLYQTPYLLTDDFAPVDNLLLPIFIEKVNHKGRFIEN